MLVDICIFFSLDLVFKCARESDLKNYTWSHQSMDGEIEDFSDDRWDSNVRIRN